MVVSDIRRHKIMEEALRSIMGAGLPPSFKFEDTYDSIVFPQGYTVPSETDVTTKFNELLAAAADNQKTPVLGDLEVGTANLYVDVSESSVGIGISTPNATLDVVGNVHVSSNLQVGDNFIVDANRGYLGIGTTTPNANLHVEGNAYITSDLNVDTGTLFVDTSTNRVGVETITPSEKLHVEGNVYISSDLQVRQDLFVKPSIGRVGVRTSNPSGGELHVKGSHRITSNLKVGQGAIYVDDTVKCGVNTVTPNANLHVEGNVYISSNLQVGDNFIVDTTTSRVGVGTTTPDANLHVEGIIHHSDANEERRVFDFANKRPKYLSSDDQFKFLAVENVNAYVFSPISGTEIYKNGTLVTTSTLTNQLTSISFVQGDVISSDGKPILVRHKAIFGQNSYYNKNHTVIPFSCAGYYFGFSNNDEGTSSTIYMYAPYGDVTVNTYVNKSIKDTPSNTINLTKQSLFVLPETETSSAVFNYIIEAVNGPILASKVNNVTGLRDTILYPGSELMYHAAEPGYNDYTKKLDIFSGNDYNKFSDVICNGPNGLVTYSPSGIPHWQTCNGDGNGGSTLQSIPYELLGDTYHTTHNVNGFALIFTDGYQEIIIESGSGSSTYTVEESDRIKGTISPYNPYVRYVGKVADQGTANNIFIRSAKSTKPFGLRLEDGAGYDQEYHAIGYLRSENDDIPIYKLRYPRYTPNMCLVKLITGVSINGGTLDAVSYPTVFTNNDYNYFITRMYASGFEISGNKIIVPSPGFYRITYYIRHYRADTNNYRTAVSIKLKVSGTELDEISETGYIRAYDSHQYTSHSMTTIAEFTPNSLEFQIGFIRRTDLTYTVETASGSFVLLEKIK
jgi:hypothetical protein